jgi:DNA repair protein RecO (recombination protein O)
MSVRTRAVLLNSAALRESDLLAVFYTLKLGKVRALVKGAKRSRKRFLGIMLHLNELEIELAPLRGREIEFRLENADLVRSRLSLALNLEKLACAFALAELVEKASPEMESDPELFRLLNDGIDAVSTPKSHREAFCQFQLDILNRLGYLPALDRCAGCGGRLEAKLGSLCFSVPRGGFVCQRCAMREKSLLQLSAGLARSLSSISRAGKSLADRIRLAEKDWLPVVNLLFSFTAWHLEKPLSSLGFLADISSPRTCAPS